MYEAHEENKMMKMDEMKHILVEIFFQSSFNNTYKLGKSEKSYFVIRVEN
jgi:hypothetical protein